jgi:hypothetical protein
MPSRTCAHDGAGTSRGREETPNPPHVPPNTDRGYRCLGQCDCRYTLFLREMAGNQFQQQGGRVHSQGPRETSYLEFSETRPPLFVKAEEPLEAN